MSKHRREVEELIEEDETPDFSNYMAVKDEDTYVISNEKKECCATEWIESDAAVSLDSNTRDQLQDILYD